MEWQTILESAIGSSPVAALSFYWAKVATRDRKEQEAQCRVELQEKDAIIAQKDATINALQESRVADLRAVMKVTPEPARLLPPKPSGSKLPF